MIFLVTKQFCAKYHKKMLKVSQDMGNLRQNESPSIMKLPQMENFLQFSDLRSNTKNICIKNYIKSWTIFENRAYPKTKKKYASQNEP